MVKRLHDTPQNIIAQIVKAECVMSGYNPDEFRVWHRHSHMQEARARVVKSALEMGITFVQVARYFQCTEKEALEAKFRLFEQERQRLASVGASHTVKAMLEGFWRKGQRKFSPMTADEYKRRCGFSVVEAAREGLAITRNINQSNPYLGTVALITDHGRKIAAMLGMVENGKK